MTPGASLLAPQKKMAKLESPGGWLQLPDAFFLTRLPETFPWWENGTGGGGVGSAGGRPGAMLVIVPFHELQRAAHEVEEGPDDGQAPDQWGHREWGWMGERFEKGEILISYDVISVAKKNECKTTALPGWCARNRSLFFCTGKVALHKIYKYMGRGGNKKQLSHSFTWLNATLRGKKQPSPG